MDDRDYDDGRGGGDERVGFHKGCGGPVHQRVSPGRRPSLRDPGEPDDVTTRCSDCGEENPETVSVEEEAYPEEVATHARTA